MIYRHTGGGGVSVYFARDRLIGQYTFNTHQLGCHFVRKKYQIVLSMDQTKKFTNLEIGAGIQSSRIPLG